MVNTIKFSQFAPANYNNANQRVGYGAGVNFQEPDAIEWTTATRPSSPSTPILGYNSDLETYEFWNPTTMVWVQLSSGSSAFTWNNIVGTSASMVANEGYVANNVSLVSLALPVTCDFGEIIGICGYGSGGWKVTVNAGQNMILGDVISTVSTGSISSSNQFDQMELLCVVANTTFIARYVIGNLSII